MLIDRYFFYTFSENHRREGEREKEKIWRKGEIDGGRRGGGREKETT